MKKTPTIKEFIKSKKWYYVNSNITSENFPKPKTIRTEGAELVKLEKYTSSEDCLELIKSKGLRPANIYELMAYVANTDIEPSTFLVAFGSDYTDSDGLHRVPRVYRYSGGDWGFSLGRFESDWGSGFVLLCFCDQTSESSTLSTDESSDSLTLTAAIEIVKNAGYRVFEEK